MESPMKYEDERGMVNSVNVYVTEETEYFDKSVQIYINMNIYSEKRWCKMKDKDISIRNYNENFEQFYSTVNDIKNSIVKDLVHAYDRESEKRRNSAAVQCADDKLNKEEVSSTETGK